MKRVEVEADGSKPASVGIFWGVPDTCGALVLVTDATPYRSAERYGDCLTHARGHHELWELWRRFGPTELARRGLPTCIAFSEYDEHPRGRIVYDMLERLFVIYADRKLQVPAMIVRISTEFGLAGARAVVRSDAHYVTQSVPY